MSWVFGGNGLDFLQPELVGKAVDGGSGLAGKPEVRVATEVGGLVLTDGEGKKYVVTNWSDERLKWHGRGLLECLQSLLQSQQHQNMLRNLENQSGDPGAQGIEAWFRILREYKGATGPRLLQIATGIFFPTKVKDLTEVPAALEAWEALVKELQTSGQPIGDLLKMVGFMQLLPDDMNKDLTRVRHDITDYGASRIWVLDQIAARRNPPKKGAEIHHVDKERDEGGQEENEPSEDELLALGRYQWDQRQGKGGSSGKGSTFEGYCSHCGIYGHRLRECRKLDKEMEERRRKGGGKNGQKGGGKNWWGSNGWSYGSGWNGGANNGYGWGGGANSWGAPDNTGGKKGGKGKYGRGAKGGRKEKGNWQGGKGKGAQNYPFMNALMGLDPSAG